MATDDGSKASKSKTAEVVAVPKQLRMEWTDIMALDTNLKPMEFRVGCVIGAHLNRGSGNSHIRLDTLATVMGVAERTVWGAVKELEAKGYLLVERREFGSHTRAKEDGSTISFLAAGGRGAANSYSPAFERSQVTATLTGSKLRNECERSLKKRLQSAATFEGSKVAADCDHSELERSQSDVVKVAADCDPTYNLPSEGNLLRAGEHPRGESSDRANWRTVMGQIKSEVGNAVFNDWLLNADFEKLIDDTIIVSAPTKFIAAEIEKKFGTRILSNWQRLQPVRHLRINVRRASIGEGR